MEKSGSTHENTNASTRKPRAMVRPTPEERDADGFTPEMRALAHALTHPDGDPYLNGRELGFYCEQCG